MDQGSAAAQGTGAVAVGFCAQRVRWTRAQGTAEGSGSGGARLMVAQDKLRARRLSAGAAQGLGRECD